MTIQAHLFFVTHVWVFYDDLSRVTFAEPVCEVPEWLLPIEQCPLDRR